MQIPIVSVFDAHKGLCKVVFFFYPPYLHLSFHPASTFSEKEDVKFNMLADSNAGPPDPRAKAVRKQFDEEIQRDSKRICISPHYPPTWLPLKNP